MPSSFAESQWLHLGNLLTWRTYQWHQQRPRTGPFQQWFPSWRLPRRPCPTCQRQMRSFWYPHPWHQRFGRYHQGFFCGSIWSWSHQYPRRLDHQPRWTWPRSQGSWRRRYQQHRSHTGKTLSFYPWSWLAGLFCRPWQCGISWSCPSCSWLQIWQRERSSRISMSTTHHLGPSGRISAWNPHHTYLEEFPSTQRQGCQWWWHRASWRCLLEFGKCAVWWPCPCQPNPWYPWRFSV